MGGTPALDEYSATEQDDSCLELDGRTMMDIGKFKGQKTLAQVHTDDKGYIQWVRNHKKGTQMSTWLLRLKTYVELRDVVKFNRVAARLAKKGVEGLMKEIDTRKKEVLEKMPAKGIEPGSSGSTPSCSTTKTTWSSTCGSEWRLRPQRFRSGRR